MLTFKQIEAAYWISKLGSFHAAAKRLNTTQSTVSKRIAELEKYLSIEIFDRSNKTTQLTIKGRELIDDFVQMLDLQQNVVRRVGSELAFVVQCAGNPGKQPVDRHHQRAGFRWHLACGQGCQVVRRTGGHFVGQLLEWP